MNSLAELGAWTQIPAVQAVLAIWTVAAGVVVWLFRTWLFPNQRNTRILTYTERTHRIVAPEKFGIPGLEVFVNGEKQPQVSVSKIAIWNHGLCTILPTDIAAADPIRVVVSDGTKILSADLLDATRKACQVQVERIGLTQEYLLHFDFLAHQDGAVIRMVHDGAPNATVIQLMGTVIEGDGIQHVRFDDASNFGPDVGLWNFRSGKWRDAFLMFFLVLSVFYAGIWLELFPRVWGMGLVVLFTSTIVLTRRLLYIRWRRTYPHIPARFVEHVAFATFYHPTESHRA